MKITKIQCLLLITIAVISSGCSNTAIQTIKPVGPAEQLLAQAETLQQSGDISSAIAQMERAVRIEPRNAYAWHKLATLQLAAGDLNKAEQFARRSNQFAAGNRELIDANQKILDEVNHLRKKSAG